MLIGIVTDFMTRSAHCAPAWTSCVRAESLSLWSRGGHAIPRPRECAWSAGQESGRNSGRNLDRPPRAAQCRSVRISLQNKRYATKWTRADTGRRSLLICGLKVRFLPGSPSTRKDVARFSPPPTLISVASALPLLASRRADQQLGPSTSPAPNARTHAARWTRPCGRVVD